MAWLHKVFKIVLQNIIENIQKIFFANNESPAKSPKLRLLEKCGNKKGSAKSLAYGMSIEL